MPETPENHQFCYFVDLKVSRETSELMTMEELITKKEIQDKLPPFLITERSTGYDVYMFHVKHCCCLILRGSEK